MRYYEFALFEAEDENPIITKLAAIVGQISSDITDTSAKEPMNVNALLNILSDEGIELSREDLQNMIGEPPLSNLIANIQGDDVIFLDPNKEDQGDAMDAEHSSEIIKQTAQRAATEPDKLQKYIPKTL